MSEKEKMLAGEMYYSSDPELQKEYREAKRKCKQINDCEFDDPQRISAFKELFKEIGDEFAILSPFFCDYGKNVTIGNQFFANHGCVILDICPVQIGNHCMFGPNVMLCAASHPLNAETRISGLEFGKPIIIEDNVWLGAGVIVNPGVTIHKNAVVASGSVVTKDVEANTLVGGVPAKFIKMIE